MAKKMWGGRFDKETDPLVEEFTRSIHYDHKLAKFDVLGSMVHVRILEKSKFLTSGEAKKLEKALDKIYAMINKGEFKHNNSCEDIHTNIQNLIAEEAGEVALKLQTARSRNDQVVFDLKLFCKNELRELQELCLKLQEALQEVCEETRDIIIPGYTHLQHAQLVYLSDYIASYIEMLKRDFIRLQNVNDNIKLNMGSGALAGTPINAELYHKAIKSFLEEKKECRGLVNDKHLCKVTNSLDTVSDRDFVIEAVSALAIIGMHMSRLAEDLIIWSTQEFGFVEIDDAFATGSSLMPQKKNPDVLELIRGYTGALNGNLISVLTVMKGLPLTYNRDMQLDKQPLFSSFAIVANEFKIMARLVKTLKWNRKEIEKRIKGDEFLYATDLAYYLIDKGVPFKKAHDAIGELVKHSIDSGRKIKEMSDKELGQFSEKLKHTEIVKLMDPVASVRSKVSIDRPKK